MTFREIYLTVLKNASFVSTGKFEKKPINLNGFSVSCWFNEINNKWYLINELKQKRMDFPKIEKLAFYLESVYLPELKKHEKIHDKIEAYGKDNVTFLNGKLVINPFIGNLSETLNDLSKLFK